MSDPAKAVSAGRQNITCPETAKNKVSYSANTPGNTCDNIGPGNQGNAACKGQGNNGNAACSDSNGGHAVYAPGHGTAAPLRLPPHYKRDPRYCHCSQWRESNAPLIVGPVPTRGDMAITREQMEEGKRRMVQIAVSWLQYKEEDRALWIGSRTDLIEIVHYVYEAQVVRTNSGVPASFRRLVWVFSERLHAKYNHGTCYHLDRNAMRRKGMYMPTMLWRFCWRMFLGNNPNPLKDLVAIVPPPPHPDDPFAD